MRILLVDDEKPLLDMMGRYLRNNGHEVVLAFNAAEALEKAITVKPEAIFLDLNLPDGSGLDLLPMFRQKIPSTGVVVMSGKNTTKSSVAVIRAGALDCLDKPFQLDEIRRLLAELSETHPTLLSRNDAPVTFTFVPPPYQKDYLFLGDAGMMEVYEKIEQVAKADGVTVLIQGETGTGKQHAARLIHDLSPRAKSSFMEIHCGAMPDTLLESELFGYEAGAFTDAKSAKPGLMEMAQGGTVFLDEIGEMPISVQAKVLKVLEQKRVRRLGGTREIQLDVRLIAATNRNLQEEIKSARFRSDLYYRLNLMSIHLPPLRGRGAVVESLARFFLDDVCRTYGHEKVWLSPRVMQALGRYHWPGNIRELKNLVFRMVLSSKGKDVEWCQLPDEIKNAFANGPLRADTVSSAVRTPSFEDIEKNALISALKQSDWNRTKAAQALGISRRTVINKIHKWNLSASDAAH